MSSCVHKRTNLTKLTIHPCPTTYHSEHKCTHSVLNGALCDMGQLHCVVCELVKLHVFKSNEIMTTDQTRAFRCFIYLNQCWLIVNWNLSVPVFRIYFSLPLHMLTRHNVLCTRWHVPETPPYKEFIRETATSDSGRNNQAGEYFYLYPLPTHHIHEIFHGFNWNIVS